MLAKQVLFRLSYVPLYLFNTLRQPLVCAFVVLSTSFHMSQRVV